MKDQRVETTTSSEWGMVRGGTNGIQDKLRSKASKNIKEGRILFKQ